MDILAQISQPGFNIEDYAPNATDTPEQAADKQAFLQEIAALQGTEELQRALPAVACMVNCVVSYLECCGGQGNNSTCWLMLSNCVENCSVS